MGNQETVEKNQKEVVKRTGRVPLSFRRPPGMDRSGYDHFYKLLICGDSAVGKSCFLLRLIEGKFYSDVMTTIGIDFKTIQAYTHQHVIKLQIWDTAGQERFSTLTDAYYRGSQGVILMFDVSNRATFNNIQLWHKKTMQHAPLCALLLMGNKVDISPRAVSEEEGQRLAEDMGMKYCETSVMLNKNIEESVLSLVEEIFYGGDPVEQEKGVDPEEVEVGREECVCYEGNVNLVSLGTPLREFLNARIGISALSSNKQHDLAFWMKIFINEQYTGMFPLAEQGTVKRFGWLTVLESGRGRYLIQCKEQNSKSFAKFLVSSCPGYSDGGELSPQQVMMSQWCLYVAYCSMDNSIPQEDVKSQLIDPDNINSLFTFHTKILGVDHCNYLLQTLRWNPLAKSLKYCESVPHPSFIKQLFQNLPILLSLQSLQLSRTQLDQVYPQFLAALKASKTLTEVDLSASNFSPKEVENLFSVLLENRSIISLNISFNNQIAKTLEKVLPLYLLNKDFVLQKLFAIGISFQNNVLVDIISALVHNKNLKNLELDGLNDALKSNRDVILMARSHSGFHPIPHLKPLTENQTLITQPNQRFTFHCMLKAVPCEGVLTMGRSIQLQKDIPPVLSQPDVKISFSSSNPLEIKISQPTMTDILFNVKYPESFSVLFALSSWIKMAKEQKGGELPPPAYASRDQRRREPVTARLQPGRRFLALVPKAPTSKQDIVQSLHTFASNRQPPLDSSVVTRFEDKVEDFMYEGQTAEVALSLALCWLYTTDSWVYQQTNHLLREDSSLMSDLAPFMNALMQSFHSMDPKLFYSGTVYRRTKLSEKGIEFYKPGLMFVWSAFSSTSVDFSEDKSFGEVLFVITIPDGKANYAMNLESISVFPAEREVLLLPNIGFLVKKMSRGSEVTWKNVSVAIEIEVAYVCV